MASTPSSTRSSRIASLWLSMPANFRGILMLSLGAFLLSGVDVLVKTLGQKFDPYELAFYRYFTGMIFLMPVFVRMGMVGLRTQRIKVHILRMVLAFVAQLGVFYSVIHLPLADATALMFSKPLFTTLAAVIILREMVDGRRWTATAFGFLGVLIMVRPGSGTVDPAALVAIGTALVFGIANVLIRVMASTEPTNRMMFYYHVGGILVFAVPTFWGWRMPEGAEWLFLLSIGALTTAGMFCYFRAFSVGEANAVGPVENMRLIYAALFGFFLFAEIPSIWTGIGAVIIVAATLYIARVEANKKA